MIKPINYTDVATRQFVYNGSVNAGQPNVIVGPATYNWLRTIFIINFSFTFWGTKASGLSIGEGAYAFVQIDGLDLNSAAVSDGSSRKPWLATCHHNGREFDVFRRVQAGNDMKVTTNLTLESNSIGVSTVELIMNMFYMMED